jgi:hypothetical protein
MNSILNGTTLSARDQPQIGAVNLTGILRIKANPIWLVTLSILIAMGGVESQIKGHMLGNVNIGKQPGNAARRHHATAGLAIRAR